jgi:hypothetical protein
MKMKLFLKRTAVLNEAATAQFNLTDKRLNLKNDINLVQTQVLYVAPVVFLHSSFRFGFRIELLNKKSRVCF